MSRGFENILRAQLCNQHFLMCSCCCVHELGQPIILSKDDLVFEFMLKFETKVKFVTNNLLHLFLGVILTFFCYAKILL